MRRVFVPKQVVVTGAWIKLHHKELNNLYSSPNIIWVIISKRMRSMGHVARMGDMRNIYKILFGSPERKRPLRRPRRIWKDNIKINFEAIGYDYVDWIHVAQDWGQWLVFVKTVMNLQVP